MIDTARMRREGREAPGLACGELCVEGAAEIDRLRKRVKELERALDYAERTSWIEEVEMEAKLLHDLFNAIEAVVDADLPWHTKRDTILAAMENSEMTKTFFNEFIAWFADDD